MKKKLGRKCANGGFVKYAGGGYSTIANYGGTTLNALAQNEDGTVDMRKQGLGTALQYGAMGSTFGPVGTLVGFGAGAVIGGVQAQKQNERQREAEIDEMLRREQEAKQRSRMILADFDTGGTDGGKRFYKHGGVQRPIASNVAVMDGATHEQGGINVGNVEVEDDEVRVDAPGVRIWFSDRLKHSSGKTYAAIAEKIGRDKGKAEEKLEGDKYSKGTGERNIEKANIKLARLASEQTAHQLSKGISPYGQKAAFGLIDPDPTEPVPPSIPPGTDPFAGMLDNPIPPPPPTTTYPTRPATISSFVKNELTPEQPDGLEPGPVNPVTRTLASLSRFRGGQVDTNAVNNVETPEEAAAKAAAREQRKATFDRNLDRFAEDVVPTLDNAVNAILTARTPHVPVPTMVKAVPLKTKVDVSASEAENRRNFRVTGESLRKSTGNSAQYRSNLLAARAQTLEANNDLYQQKENVETQLVNQNRMNQQQVSNTNTGAWNQFAANKYGRKLQIQQDVSANVSNFVEDMRLNQLQKNQRRMDTASIALLQKRFEESGIFDRTMQGYVSELLNGANPDEILDKMAKYAKTSKKTD